MKNNNVLKAFLNNHEGKYKSSSLTLEDGKLYSFATLLAKRENGLIHLNTTKYSKTTTTAQNYIKRNILNYVAIENIPMGGNF